MFHFRGHFSSFRRLDLHFGMCDACLRGKTNQVHVSESVEADMNPAGVFEHMHMYIKDLMCKSLQGNLYTMFVVDKGSGKYHADTKMNKEEVVAQFVRDEVLPSNHPMVKTLTADCDPNFLDARFPELCQLMVIRIELSPSHKHQCNGRAERAIQEGATLSALSFCTRTICASTGSLDTTGAIDGPLQYCTVPVFIPMQPAQSPLMPHIDTDAVRGALTVEE
jgi:hypothetical protein